MQISKGAKGSGTYLFYLVMALIFVDTVLYGVIVPLIPIYTAELGLNTLAISIIYAAYSLGLLLFSMPMGLLAEKIGYKKVFVSGLSLLTLSSLLYGLVDGGVILAICRFVQGVAAATTWTAGMAMIAVLYPEQQGEKLGLVLAAMGVGTVLGPPIGGALYQYLGYQAMFFVLAFVLGILLLVVLKMRFDFTGIIKGETGDQWQKKLRFTPSLLWLCVVVVFASSSFGMLEIIMPNYMFQRFAMNSLQIGMVFGVMGILHGFSDALVGFWSDRLGYAPFVFWGLVAAACVFPLLALTPSILLLTGAFTLLGVAIGAAITPSQPLMYQIIAADPRMPERGGAGLAYGLYNTCFSIGLFVGPLLGGILDRYLDLLAGLMVFTAIFLAAAVLFSCKVKTVPKVIESEN